MALGISDILQIVDKQALDNNQLLNVYYYRVTAKGATADLASVATCFLSDMQAPVLDLQDSNLVHIGLEIRNLSNGLDIYEATTTATGGTAGTHAPNFVAAGFRLIRASLSTRHGAKRYGGITEEFLNGNDLAAAANAAIAPIETALAADISWPGTGTNEVTCEPVIIGRTLDPADGKWKLDITVVNQISSAQYIRVTSQVSRRAGRGS